MEKSPQQAIYDTVFLTSLNLGYSTYPYLPPDKTSYPFVYVGEQFDQDLETKTSVYGLVTQTIHIYHTYRERRELTDMMNALKWEIRKLKRAESYRVAVRNINTQTIMDDSTGQPLLHGIISVEFRYN